MMSDDGDNNYTNNNDNNGSQPKQFLPRFKLTFNLKICFHCQFILWNPLLPLLSLLPLSLCNVKYCEFLADFCRVKNGGNERGGGGEGMGPRELRKRHGKNNKSRNPPGSMSKKSLKNNVNNGNTTAVASPDQWELFWQFLRRPIREKHQWNKLNQQMSNFLLLR